MHVHTRYAAAVAAAAATTILAGCGGSPTGTSSPTATPTTEPSISISLQAPPPPPAAGATVTCGTDGVDPGTWRVTQSTEFDWAAGRHPLPHITAGSVLYDVGAPQEKVDGVMWQPVGCYHRDGASSATLQLGWVRNSALRAAPTDHTGGTA